MPGLRRGICRCRPETHPQTLGTDQQEAGSGSPGMRRPAQPSANRDRRLSSALLGATLERDEMRLVAARDGPHFSHARMHLSGLLDLAFSDSVTPHFYFAWGCFRNFWVRSEEH